MKQAAKSAEEIQALLLVSGLGALLLREILAERWHTAPVFMLTVQDDNIMMGSESWGLSVSPAFGMSTERAVECFNVVQAAYYAGDIPADVVEDVRASVFEDLASPTIQRIVENIRRELVDGIKTPRGELLN